MTTKRLAAFCFILFFSQIFSLSAANKVLWVPFKGTVELGLSPYIVRALKYAEDQKYDAVILDIDTFGGRVDAAVVMRDALIDSKMLTVAWVNKRAISAGALISLACKKIFFTPGSTMGAATPIQASPGGEAQSVGEKVISYFRAEMGSTADRFGRDKKIAESMVRASEDIKGLVKKDEVLTLTDQTALSTKISDGTVENKEKLLEAIQMANAQVDIFEINWAESIVRFLTDPTVSGLLMSGGVLGIIIELKAPGFGLGGFLALVCFALFFGGKFLVHLAGWEEVILLAFGVMALLIEFLVFPGTVISGAIGLCLIALSLLLAGVPKQIPIDFSFPDLQSHLNGVGIAFFVALAGLILVYYWFIKNPLNSPMVMGETLPSGDLSQESNIPLGTQGEVETDLHPAGKVRFGEKSIEVITESGQFISKGEKVILSRREGFQNFVKPHH